MFAALVAGLYFRIAGFGLWVSFIVLTALVVFAPKNLRMQAVDWSVILIAAFEIVTLPFSQYSVNSVHTSLIIAVSVLMFFAVRLTTRKSMQVFLLSGVLGVCGACSGLNSIAQFGAQVGRLTDAGFSDLVAFRSRLITPPQHWIIGEWFTVVLLTLPFACAVAAHFGLRGRWWLAALALVPPSIVTGVLTLSLSRSVFWSTVLFYFSVCALLAFSKVVSFRIGGMLLAITLGVLVLILAFESALYPGLIKAYAGQHTTQTRSTHGRVGIWTRSFDLVRAHPLLGVGASNAGLMLLSSGDDEKNIAFAGRTFSLPVQILLEKGIVGLLLYSGFLVLVGREFVRTIRYSPPSSGPSERRTDNANHIVANFERAKVFADGSNSLASKAMACCFAAGLVAVFCRELTYSSLMEHGLTMVLVATLAALVSRSEISGPNQMRMKSIAIGVAVITLSLHLYVGDYEQADAKLETYYAQILAADFVGARESIDKAISLCPSNARYYGWRAYLTSQNLPPRCTYGLKDFHPALKPGDESAVHLAIGDYRKAIELNGRDAIAYHNLGWLEHLLGKNVSATQDWETAIEIDPTNVPFRLSYGMFLDETGNAAKAKEEFQTAIELSPSTLDSQFFTRYRIHDRNAADSVVAAAISVLGRDLGRGNDPVVEARLGKLYLFKGELSRASQLLEDAAKELPNLPLVWVNLGEVKERQGSLPAAMVCYKKANVVNGSLAGPYLRMGELELQSGQQRTSFQNFSKAIERWQRVNPLSAAHNSRLYIEPWQRIDDLLPTTLVWYTTPCEASRAWTGLSRLYPSNREYAERTHMCEDLPSPHAE